MNYGKQDPYTGKEDNFQKASNTALRLQFPLLYTYAFHVPNGGKRPTKTYVKKSKVVSYSPEGKKMKLSGAKAGVSDWLILCPFGQHHGACIELKVKGGKLQQSQIDFLQRQKNQGYFVAVAWSMDGFLEAIQEFING